MLLVVGVAGWAIRRRYAHVSVDATFRPDAGARPGPGEAGIPHPERLDRQPPRPGDARGEELLQRLHAVAFEEAAFGRDAVVAGTPHASVVSHAVATLAKIDT